MTAFVAVVAAASMFASGPDAVPVEVPATSGIAVGDTYAASIAEGGFSRVSSPADLCRADRGVYGNASFFTGGAFQQNGLPVYDDISVATGAGDTLSALTFTLANFSEIGTYTGGLVRVEITTIDAGFNPGEVLFTNDFDLDAIFDGTLEVAPQNLSFIALDGLETFNVTVPAGPFFVGITYLTAGGADSVGVLGQAIFDPPTVGASSPSFSQGNGPITFETLPGSFGLVVGVRAPDTVPYTLHQVPTPQDLDVLIGSPSINNLGEVVVGYDFFDDGYLYLGTPESGRTFRMREVASANSARTFTINDASEAFYNVVFARPGDEKGVYRVPVASGGSTRLNQIPGNNLLGPQLFGTENGDAVGTILIPGDNSDALLVRYDGSAPPSAPFVVAQDIGLDPMSDIAQILLLTANKQGDVVAILELVTGGSELRLFPADGAPPITLAKDQAADPASPVLAFDELGAPGLNDHGQIVFLGLDGAQNKVFFEADASGVRVLLGAQDLAEAAVVSPPAQRLSLNNAGEFAFRASPLHIQPNLIGLWRANLAGEIEEIFRTTCTYTDQVSGADVSLGSFSLGDTTMNEHGEIVFYAPIGVGEGGRRAWVARPVEADCPADLTGNGVCDPATADSAVTLSDFSCYLTTWVNGDASADITTTGTSSGPPDGRVDLSDFSSYLSLWAAGCP